jgi:hypothetical protein
MSVLYKTSIGGMAGIINGCGGCVGVRASDFSLTSITSTYAMEGDYLLTFFIARVHRLMHSFWILDLKARKL